MQYVLAVYLPGLLLGGLAFWWSMTHGLWWATLIGWALVSGLGIAVGFHRIYSHKTHELPEWLDNLILLLGTLGGQGSSISWVAVHRGYHHRFSDTPKDLHSPVNGFWNSVIGWYWKLTPETINHKYAVDLLRRPNHVLVHRHYIIHLWSCVVFIAALYPLFGWTPLFLYGSVLFISLVQDNLVNSLCHLTKVGYANFDVGDRSRNFWLLGYFGWGQGWHNNHHALPAQFDFGVKWWEFDPCRLWLPFLKLFGATARVEKTNGIA